MDRNDRTVQTEPLPLRNRGNIVFNSKESHDSSQINLHIPVVSVRVTEKIQ